jgi:predicted secreted protein
MATVRGKDVTVRIYDGGWKLYACARSCSLNISTSVIETSVTGSGTWATYIPQKHGWTGTLEGMMNLDSDSSLTLYDLRLKQVAMEVIQIQFERLDDDGNSYTDTGNAIITSSSDSGSVDDVASFSIELQGTGALTPLYTEYPGADNGLLAEDESDLITESGLFITIE